MWIRFEMKIILLIFINFIISSLLFSQEEPLLLTIETSINLALNQNRAFLKTASGVEKSEMALGLKETAFDLKITPQAESGYGGGGTGGTGWTLGGGLKVEKKFQNGVNFNFSPSVAKKESLYRSNITSTLRVPLLKGFGYEYNLAEVRAGEYSLRSAIRSLYKAQVQLIVDVIRNLYEVVKLIKIVEINQGAYERLIQFNRSVKVKEKIGIADQLDIFRAEIALQQAEDAFNQSKQSLLDAEDTLRNQLALPLVTPIKIEVPVEYHPTLMPLFDAIDVALANRIEIDQAEDDLSNQKFLASLAKVKLLPDLDLVMTHNRSGTDETFSRSYFRRPLNTWEIGFSTTSNVNQTNEKYGYFQAKLAVEDSEISLSEAFAKVESDVQSSYSRLQRSFEKIQFQEQQMVSAQAELKFALVKFNHGRANNFDVLQAEKTYQTSHSSLFSAVVEHIIEEYRLMLNMGLLSEKPCI